VTSFETRRQLFGERLRGMRSRAGVSGRELAEALATSQSKISKIETGRQTPTDEDVTAWCEALDAPEATVAELLAELAELRVEQRDWRRQLRAGHRGRQQQISELEQNAGRIRAVEVVAVPGLLQTADYARRMFAAQAELLEYGRDLDDAVRARMARQQLLYESGRSIEILVAEAGLRHSICPPTEMAGQVDRLVSVLGLPGVRFGVLPLGRRLPFAVMHGFNLLDDVALVDTLSSELRIDDPEQVAVYHRVVDRLWPVAAEAGEARAVLARIAEDLALADRDCS
jgi:transcriptional regulator with XRE-family HTH domain